ncbi:hypothetical protein MNBD_IGNAVI01-1913 [hydrothermal vent metagenome]|uniref:Uncharacterized protein n=1 Tax=hydrothermal vent metagenome TaxID=652676 RepID=A0A3B1CUP3_9ZZZZ
MLKKILFILLFITSVSFSQFKDGDKNAPTIHDGLSGYSSSGFLSNIFNPNNFQMNQSVSMSYSAFGGNGVALSTYTNSMAYRFSNNLNIQVDASLVVSPYSTFGREYQKAINGIYLSRAQLNYSPTKNMHISVQYLNTPPGSYYYPNSFWGSSYGGRRFGTGF